MFVIGLKGFLIFGWRGRNNNSDTGRIDGVPAMNPYTITAVWPLDFYSAWSSEFDQSIRDVPF